MLKTSMHADFDNWKRTVMKQVKTECLKYRQRLRGSMTGRQEMEAATDFNSASLAEDGEEFMNEKELDFLFDEVDWTGDVEQMNSSPDRMKEYVDAAVTKIVTPPASPKVEE